MCTKSITYNRRMSKVCAPSTLASSFPIGNSAKISAAFLTISKFSPTKFHYEKKD